MSKQTAKNEIGFCRDCARPIGAARRCPECGSPRLIRHQELTQLAIAHIDCDAFFAAVEKRDNPELIDQPVIIGSGARGVVSTACYQARIYGVRSAMPLFKARKACPQAVIIPPNIEKYAAIGAQIKDTMRALTPLVQSLSIDEAFLDLSGTEKLHGCTPAQSLIKLARRIENEIGISVSIGLSHNKFLAKLASDMDKPRGFRVIGRAETKTLLAALPVDKIWGVGKAMQKKLARDGITHIGQLQAMELSALVARYGTMGLHLAACAHGKDSRAVTTTRIEKSISSETTFETDIAAPAQLEKILWRQCERTAQRCKYKGRAGATLTLKMKSAQFVTLSRNKRLPQPTQMADTLYEYARPLMHDILRQEPKRAYRLLGVGVSGLVDAAAADAPDLADPDKTRKVALDRAMDRVRDRFGTAIISKGRGL